MGIYQRDGIYYVKISEPNGRVVRHSTGTANRKKAQEYHDRLKTQLWDQQRIGVKPTYTWDEAALKWLQEKKHKASLMEDKRHIRWFTHHLRGRALDSITRAEIDQLITKQLAGRADRTKDLYVATIRGILRAAQREWEWITNAPAFRTYTRGQTIRVRALTRDQAEALLSYLPPHQRAPVVFALATGLRQGNVLNLRWEWVDLEKRVARIPHGTTKNREALAVPLNDIALGLLRAEQGKHPERVFTYCGRPLAEANTRAWRRAVQKTGLEDFRWHDLRHTWATWLRMEGVPTWILQELAGWKSEAMVRRYAHINADHLAVYAAKAGHTFGHSGPKQS